MVGELQQCRYVFDCEQAYMNGESFDDLSEEQYMKIVEENVASFKTRLNFSQGDHAKLADAARSFVGVLGGCNPRLR